MGDFDMQREGAWERAWNRLYSSIGFLVTEVLFRIMALKRCHPLTPRDRYGERNTRKNVFFVRNALDRDEANANISWQL